MKKWDETFIKSLKLYEEHSKCSAKKVACILVKDNNILSIGINGTIKGKVNCYDKFKKENGKWYENRIVKSREFISPYQYRFLNKEKDWVLCEDQEAHSKWSELYEIHAEMNAINKATRDNNSNLEGSTAYISYSPCMNCAKMLVLFGIKKVVFKELYDDVKIVVKYLMENDIEVIYWDNDLNKLLLEHSGFTFRVGSDGLIDEIYDNTNGLYYVNPCRTFNRKSYQNHKNILENLNIMCNNNLIKLIEYGIDDVYRDDDFIFTEIYTKDNFLFKEQEDSFLFLYLKLNKRGDNNENM